jgi:hypothetical protein
MASPRSARARMNSNVAMAKKLAQAGKAALPALGVALPGAGAIAKTVAGPVGSAVSELAFPDEANAFDDPKAIREWKK